MPFDRRTSFHSVSSFGFCMMDQACECEREREREREREGEGETEILSERGIMVIVFNTQREST